MSSTSVCKNADERVRSKWLLAPVDRHVLTRGFAVPSAVWKSASFLVQRPVPDALFRRLSELAQFVRDLLEFLAHLESLKPSLRDRLFTESCSEQRARDGTERGRIATEVDRTHKAFFEINRIQH